MSTRIIYWPLSIKAKGRWRHWVPELGSFIGNDASAKARAKELRILHPDATIRRFGGHVNFYI